MTLTFICFVCCLKEQAVWLAKRNERKNGVHQAHTKIQESRVRQETEHKTPT